MMVASFQPIARRPGKKPRSWEASGRMMIISRRSLKWVIGLLVALIIAHYAVAFFFPWSPINCQHQDVDIKTGRLRFIRSLMFCRIRESIKDSPLSKVLPADFVSTANPEWHRVNTFSPGVHYSPHYIFHSAIYQIHTLADIWETWEKCGFPEDLRRQTALHLLALWQHSGSDSLVDGYIDGLYDLNRQQILTSLPALHMPLVETNGSQVVRTVFFPNGQPMDRIQGYVNPSGEFIRHGVWERWRSDGTRWSVLYENDKRLP